MIYRHNRATLAVFFVFVAVLLSCGDKSTNSQGPFDVFGRIVNRPLEAGLSFSEFYIFHNGNAVNDAIITVNGDTVRNATDAGHYYRDGMNFRIGDTLSYSINSQFGAKQGAVIIPDSVGIINPQPSEVIFIGVDYSAAWHRGDFVDGYYAYLKRQNGHAAQVEDIRIDTTAQISGQNITNIGIDTFWVETLKGSFNVATAPNGMVLPIGVVGATGSFRNVEITIAPPLAEGKTKI